jgi:hypothetical protein
VPESNEDLLRELIDAAYDSGYDAATMERAAEWEKELDLGDNILLSEDARIGWERHLNEAIKVREEARQEVLRRMTTTFGEKVAHLAGQDLWREASIRDQFGFCPRGGTQPGDHVSQAIEVDIEELQMHAHEAWETLLKTTMTSVRHIHDEGPAGDALRRRVAEEHGVPLWCPLCGEPAEDVFSEGDPLE